MSDAAADAGLSVLALPTDVQAALHAANPLGAAANPVDVTGQAMKEPGLVGGALAAVLAGHHVDVVALFLMNWLVSPEMEPGLAAEIDAALKNATAPLSIVGTMPAEFAARWRDRGVPIFDDPDRANRRAVAARSCEHGALRQH